MPINYLKQIQLSEFNELDYRISPSPEVASVIEGFYIFSTDPKNDTHLIFNDGFPVIVFLENQQGSVTVTSGNDTFEIESAWASAGSIKNTYVKYNNHTSQVFIIRFCPGPFYQLFALESSYFRSQPLRSFEEIARTIDFSLKELFNCKAIKEKIAFVEKYVQNSLAKIQTPEILHKTLDYIHRTKGQITVGSMTNDVGVSYKWLERSFAKNIGLLPKEYIQLQRFIKAYLGLIGRRDIDLMETAVSNGYYDYNHFLKDFKTFTGKTPLAYLKYQL